MVKSGLRTSKIKIKTKNFGVQPWHRYRVSYTSYLENLSSQKENFPRLMASTNEVSVRTRLNVTSSSFDDDLKKLYKMAVGKMIEKGINGEAGTYGELAGIHSDGSLFIHSPQHYVNHRFLPWHRIYLIEFERLLNAALGNEYNLAVPYWDWETDREIPDFFKDWTPDVLVNTRDTVGGQIVIKPEEIQVTRWPGRFYDPSTKQWYDVPLPTREDIDTDVRTQTVFNEFTKNLEDYHGTVHVWAGGSDPNNPLTRGTIGNIWKSPTDPLFWSHHANIDRIWAEWQNKNKDKNPVLDKTGSIMNPFSPYTEKDTRDTVNLGYFYK